MMGALSNGSCGIAFPIELDNQSGTVHGDGMAELRARETIHLKTLTLIDQMVFGIRRTLTVGEHVAAFEHTNAVTRAAADEERRKCEEKTARLRNLRSEAEKKAWARRHIVLMPTTSHRISL